MKRSLKVSLKFSNTGKKEALDALWKEYRKVISDFLEHLFARRELTEEFLKSYSSPLSYRYKQCAKRQAMKFFKTWCQKKGKKSKPSLRNSSMTLDHRFIEVQSSCNYFDFWVKIATLEKGKPILIPAKSYAYLNHYLDDWELVPGGRLVKRDNEWFLQLAFRKEKPELKSGKVKAIDIGYRKLGVTSEGEIIGEKLPELIEKAVRKKQFSKGYYQAKQEIKRYVNHELKKLFPDRVGTLIFEDLKRLKDKKHGEWLRKINRRFGFWIYGHVLRRLKELGEVGGVHCLQVPPHGTSQTCPLCGHKEKLNRKRECFKCCRCNFKHDADYVGALNILHRFTGKPIVLQAIKPHLEYFSI